MGWFKKHKVLTVVLAIIVIVVIGTVADDNNNLSNSNSEKDSSQSVEPNSSQPKYSYDDFATWITSTASKEYYWKYDGIGENNISTYNTIINHCGNDGNWDSGWKSCMQEAYIDYLKPETFSSDQNIYDFLSMYGTIFNEQFGQADSDSVKAAQTIYERLSTAE